jgi:hypothetical protein
MGDLTHASADVPLAIVQGALAQLVSLPAVEELEAELSREENRR